MPSGTFTASQPTPWFKVGGDRGVLASCKNVAGTITIQQRIEGSAYPLQDDLGDDVVLTADGNRLLQVREGEVIRLLPDASGGGVWSLTGHVQQTS